MHKYFNRLEIGSEAAKLAVTKALVSDAVKQKLAHWADIKAEVKKLLDARTVDGYIKALALVLTKDTSLFDLVNRARLDLASTTDHVGLIDKTARIVRSLIDAAVELSKEKEKDAKDKNATHALEREIGRAHV